MSSRVIHDFDPVEWKELAPGMFCHRQNRTMIAFRCPKPNERVKQEEQKVEEKEEQKTQTINRENTSSNSDPPKAS